MELDEQTLGLIVFVIVYSAVIGVIVAALVISVMVNK